MHTIKITPNLLLEYQCTSGKFIRLPNLIESKNRFGSKIESNRIEIFLPELECSTVNCSFSSWLTNATYDSHTIRNTKRLQQRTVTFSAYYFTNLLNYVGRTRDFRYLNKYLPTLECQLWKLWNVVSYKSAAYSQFPLTRVTPLVLPLTYGTERQNLSDQMPHQQSWFHMRPSPSTQVKRLSGVKKKRLFSKLAVTLFLTVNAGVSV